MAEDPDSEGNLTGYWSGSFSYAGGEGPTPFSAHISDISGSISGTTLEPNTFARRPLTELGADIAGAANGHSVSFVKRYHRGPGVHRNPIYYSGATDAKFTSYRGHVALQQRLLGNLRDDPGVRRREGRGAGA